MRGTIIETISPLLRSRSPVPKQKASSPLLPLNEHVTTPKATCIMPSPSGPPVALSPAPSMPSTLPYEDQSPESLASTIPYSPGMQIPVIEEEEVIPYPNNPPTKRTIDESPEGSVPHKTQKATTELGNSATASSSGQNDGKVLLPLKEEESENDEAEPDAMWNQDESIDSDDLDVERELYFWLKEIEKESGQEVEFHEDLQYMIREVKDQVQRIEIGIGSELISEQQDENELPTIVIYEATESSKSFTHVKGKPLEKTALTKQEISDNLAKVNSLKFKEILGLHNLGCFKRRRKRRDDNVVDTRWVITWKMIDGKLEIKVRLTMRGFKDRDQDLETFAGTATRTGQKVVNHCVAQNPNFELFSFDVSQAFAKGLTFEDLSQLTGTEVRKVQFRLAPEDIPILRKIPGYEDFDPETEVLEMIKPIYGLKDAPRAWRKRLHQVLVEFGCVSLLAEPEIYVKHEDEPRKQEHLSIKERREKEQSAREGSDYQYGEQWLQNRKQKLELILSTHVDDLKGGARKAIAEKLLKFLNDKFGACKAEWNRFTHTGVEHERSEEGIYCHQKKYAAEKLKAITLEKNATDDKGPVTEELHTKYSEQLGKVAWMVLTRADDAIYIQSLQRRNHNPRYSDIKRLNAVIRHMQRKPLGIWCPMIRTENVRILGFTDSAFKAQEDENTALALRGLAALIASDDKREQQKGVIEIGTDHDIHLMEWIVRRLKRVVRSTFAAELNALIDTIESLLLLQLILHQCYCGTDEDAEQLIIKLEAGKLYPPIDVFVDAKSVSDAISANELCTPQESSLKVHLIAIRDRLQRGLLRSISWTDTRDMLADALTKGGINRDMIQSAMQGRLRMCHDTVPHQAPRH